MKEIDNLSKCIKSYTDTRNFNIESNVFMAEFIEDFYGWRKGSSKNSDFKNKSELENELFNYLRDIKNKPSYKE